MTNDKYIKDGLTVNEIYRSFERRKRRRRIKAKLFLKQNNKIIGKASRSECSPFLLIPLGVISSLLLGVLIKQFKQRIKTKFPNY